MKKANHFFSGILLGVCIMVLVQFIIGQTLAKTPSTVSDVSDVQTKAETLIKLLESKYVDDFDMDDVIEGMYKGMVDAIGDPFTAYMTAENYQAFEEDAKSQIAGIGVVVSALADDNTITVVSPIKDTPGAEAGILPEDKIIQVNGTDVTAADMEEAVRMMKGDPGTSVNITVYRPRTQETFKLDIVRAIINVPTVSHEMMEDGIGYIQLSHFSTNTFLEFKEAHEALQAEGELSGLIIDLRNNPGGILSVVVDIADYLLPEGTIVYTIDKNGKKEESKSDANYVDLPMVLLVNGGSASASEVLAGAVKDFGAGTLVGTQTFGKGLVQQVIPLRDGSALKVTIQRYYTPSGVCIQGIGIEPDYIIEFSEEDIENLFDSQLYKAKDLLLMAQ